MLQDVVDVGTHGRQHVHAEHAVLRIEEEAGSRVDGDRLPLPAEWVLDPELAAESDELRGEREPGERAADLCLRGGNRTAAGLRARMAFDTTSAMMPGSVPRPWP